MAEKAKAWGHAREDGSRSGERQGKQKPLHDRHSGKYIFNLPPSTEQRETSHAVPDHQKQLTFRGVA